MLTPSAIHIAWTPPSAVDPRDAGGRSRPLIGSLAVDVEPTVFWDGLAPSPADELARWRAEVDFEPVTHGTATLGTNGPSGAGLIDTVLTPLGLDAASCAYTDAMPWYFVKYDKGGQGRAIRDRLAPIAQTLGVHAGSIPARPSRRVLVELVCGTARRDLLRAELIEADPPLVITLGQEALDVMSAVATTSGVRQQLSPDGYGAVGVVALDGRRIPLLPLAHPGFVRQTKNEAWRLALASWRERRS